MAETQVYATATEQLLAYIREQVAKYQTDYNLSLGKAFMLWYGIEAIHLSEDAAYEASSYDGGNDRSIDFFYVDDDNERVVIAQGKYGAQGRQTPTVGQFLELVHTTDWLRNPELFEADGRSDLAEAAKSYLEAVNDGFATHFHFVYMGEPQNDVVAASLNYNNAHLADIPPQTSRIIDLNGLQQIHEEHINADTRISSAVIKLIPEKAFQQAGAYGKSLTATIQGTELQKLYSDHGDSLFDRNVRVFLGTRSGSVNAGIRDTLASDQERQYFWAYNNGITVVCDRYEFDESTGDLTIHNFSIVNGCQTTVSVARGPNPAPPEVGILARFIAASDNQVVDNIIRFTNSQTPIRLWDIASQDSTQKRLKRELDDEPNPFFYELRRGEGPEDRGRFTRRNRLHSIKPDLLAQYLAAFKGLPVIAYKYKASLFTTHRETVFPASIRVEEVILAWLAGEAAQNAAKNALIDAQDRGEQRRQLILKRGAKIFTLAVMGIIMAERNGATYLARISRETASSNANRERLSNYATLSVEWYVQAMEELLDSGEDLSVLIRNQETFGRIHQKVLSKWRVQAMDQSWVTNVLPRIGS